MTRQLLSVDDMSLDTLMALSTQNACTTVESPPLRGTLAFLFQQPSLRTLSSFASAGVRLGLAPVPVHTTGSNWRDGCDIDDEIFQLGLTSACVVVRRDVALDAAKARDCPAPLINAGDGLNEHPTQAVLDVAALRRLGLAGKRVVLMGNLRDHRVHHSLAKALQKLGVSITLLCPPGYAMDPVYLSYPAPCVLASTEAEVDEVLSQADYIYMTPITHWVVMDSPHIGSYTIDLARARRVLRPGARILHPFPRKDELARDVDASPYNAYHLQTRIAPAIRCRVLRWVIDGELPSDTGHV